MKERQIRLVDFIAEVLLHWRGIILLMLIGSVCFAGISYIKSFRSTEAKKQQQELEEELERELMKTGGMEAILTEQLTEVQIYNVKSAIMYENIYKDRIIYGDNSALMKYNPNEVAKAQLLFLVKSDNLEQSYNIEKVYERLVSGNSLYEYLDTEYGIDASIASEIVYLESGTLANGVDAGTFRLTIKYYDKEQCGNLAQAIVDYIEDWKQELQGELGEHDVVVLDRSLVLVSDSDILNRQRTYLNDIYSIMSAAVRLKDAFSDEEKEYYEYLVNQQSVSETEFNEEKTGESMIESNENSELQSTIPSTPSISFKYSIFGAMLMAIAYIFIIFLRYILDAKLKYSDDLQELYDLPLLGQIPKTKVDKSMNCIDKWICSLRDRDKRRFTLEEAVNLTAASINIVAKKSNLKEISLIGCDIKGETCSVCEQIKEHLKKEGIKVNILNNVIYDAEAMERLDSVQGVVLVETAGSTLYEEVSREIDLMQRQNIVILGGVVHE